jgi:hypothetical protein
MSRKRHKGRKRGASSASEGSPSAHGGTRKQKTARSRPRQGERSDEVIGDERITSVSESESGGVVASVEHDTAEADGIDSSD